VSSAVNINHLSFISALSRYRKTTKAQLQLRATTDRSVPPAVEGETRDCGLRIADCGLKTGRFSSFRNPNSAIRNRYARLLIIFLLVGVTLVAYESVRKYEFVDYDDDRYVTNNPRIRRGLSWNNVAWAMTATEVANWHPLTWLSHMMDCQLYGLNPAGHHLTNLLLHLANVVLLFWVLQQMTGALWPSAMVAALFAVHPLNVESVAWVAERKNVLSTLFWLLTMWAYVIYARRAGWRRYLLVAGLFVLGLMSKPMLVTLPCVLLLLDYWPLGRLSGRAAVESAASYQRPDETDRHSRQVDLRAPAFAACALRLVLEKLPLFLLAAASSAITVEAQRLDGAFDAKVLPLGTRLANALVSYASYIYKMIWPDHLAVLYPHPGASLQGWRVIVSALALTFITFLVVWGSKRFPYLMVGWLWYVGTLVPVIGLVQVGGQAMADRYSYIPLIGLFIIIAWGMTDLSRFVPARNYWLIGVAAAVLIALTMTARRQLSYWQNSITLFEHTLAVTDDNAIAHNNLGAVLVGKGRLDEGLAHLYEAVRLNPDYGTAYANIAFTLYQQANIAAQDEGRWEEAVDLYRRALELKPDFTEARQNLDLLLAKMGKKER
jgi:tetratricopeptide (TPR) repeat protein